MNFVHSTSEGFYPVEEAEAKKEGRRAITRIARRSSFFAARMEHPLDML